MSASALAVEVGLLALLLGGSRATADVVGRTADTDVRAGKISLVVAVVVVVASVVVVILIETTSVSATTAA